MIRDYFLMALGNLRHRGLRSWLTMLGIFIGIAAVVSLISLGAGFLSSKEANDAVKLWLNTKFSNHPRHVRRLKEISRFERR